MGDRYSGGIAEASFDVCIAFVVLFTYILVIDDVGTLADWLK